MKHFPVRWDGHELSFGFGKFTTVQELLEHFDSKPVIGGESGKVWLFVLGGKSGKARVHVIGRKSGKFWVHVVG